MTIKTVNPTTTNKNDESSPQSESNSNQLSTENIPTSSESEVNKKVQASEDGEAEITFQRRSQFKLSENSKRRFH